MSRVDAATSLRPPTRDVYQSITDRIVAAVEANPANPTMPWHRTGLSTVMPTNAATGNKYRGINVVALWAEAQIREFPYAVWSSYKQWQSIGAQVRKGERASTVVFYRDYSVEPDPENPDDDGKRFVAKASSVFNSSQVDGYTPAEPPPPLPPLERNALAEAFIAATKADIRIGGESAYYRPSSDHIQMPDENLFRDPITEIRSTDWYSVICHELGHWSGATKRLNRQFGKKFGDQAYCVEELVGELTSAFVTTSLGLTPTPRPDHAQYIAHYLRLMRSEPRAIFAAAAKAAEAADYLRAFSEPADTVPPPSDTVERA
jgi:antirestriction protein ArdC